MGAENEGIGLKNTYFGNSNPEESIRYRGPTPDRIRNLERLLKEHGGKPSMWTKKSSPAVEIDGDLYEYHWYEHHGIGIFEIKGKKVRDL